MRATSHPERPEAGASKPLLAAVEDPPRLDDEDIRTALKVARYARQTYPGPIGELIENSLQRYVEIGYQLDPAGLEPGSWRQSRRLPTPRPAGTATATYRPATGLEARCIGTTGDAGAVRGSSRTSLRRWLPS